MASKNKKFIRPIEATVVVFGNIFAKLSGQIVRYSVAKIKKQTETSLEHFPMQTKPG